MGETVKTIKEYATIIFTLLGILFGVMIMTFVFGQLGPSTAGLTSANLAYNTSLAIQNNSLGGLQAYSAGTTTQMNTVSIAIVLVLLIGVFLIFWKIFVSNKNKSRSRGYGGEMGGNFA